MDKHKKYYDEDPQEVYRLHTEGYGISTISEKTLLHEKTVEEIIMKKMMENNHNNKHKILDTNLLEVNLNSTSIINNTIVVDNVEVNVKDANELLINLIKYYVTTKFLNNYSLMPFTTVLKNRKPDETMPQAKDRLYSELKETKKIIESLLIEK